MKRTLLLVLGFALLAATSARAVPVLQLDIAGGHYDPVSETIVTSSDAFTLYAYGTPSPNTSANTILHTTYYLSVALTPETGPANSSLGSFTVNGHTYTATQDMKYGIPPIEANGTAGHDGGDLGAHGIYDTFFTEIPLTFTAANTSGEYNTADHAGQGPIPGSSMYYVAFSVDKSLLDPNYQLHFDLYSIQHGRGTDLDIADFAPFSHDAGTVGRPVPEPTAALVFGAALVVTNLSMRRRSA